MNKNNIKESASDKSPISREEEVAKRHFGMMEYLAEDEEEYSSEGTKKNITRIAKKNIDQAIL